MAGRKCIFVICIVVCLAAVSAIPYSNVPLPDNCKWANKDRGFVSCTGDIPSFAASDPTQLSAIRYLEIKDCGPTILSNDSFSGVNNLVLLTIKCKIISVEPGVFDNLTKLQGLSLQEEANILPEGLFCGLPSLQALDLSRNTLTINTKLGFSSQCVTSSDLCGANITDLNIAFNEITALTGELFCNFPNLESFNASNNEISTIQPAAFSYTSNLKKLYLGNNSLSALNSDTFESAVNLTVLDLSYNQLTLIPIALFKNLTQLTQLNLGGNKLESINENAFLDLSSLTNLDLRGNFLTKLDNALFPLHKLRTLDLSDNKLSEISATNFNGLTLLNHLDLNNNNLVSFNKSAFQFNPRLTVLSVNNNKLTAIPDLTYTRLLFALHAANNSITKLSETAFENSSLILIMNLANNKLAAIGNKTFKNQLHLLKLDLSFNEIATIENGSFDSLTTLRFLSINNNKLTLEENTYSAGDIPDTMDLFGQLDSLVYLNLSSNAISHFSYSWFPANIVYLSVSNNSVSSLPVYNVLQDPTPHMHTLDLSNNEIVNVATSQFPPSLTNIILSVNKIQSVDKDAFVELKGLDHLFLRNNNLMTLPQLNMGSTLTTLTLSDNPWSCDCKLNWLRQTRNLPILVYDALLMKCKVLFNRTLTDSMPLLVGEDSDFLCTFKQDVDDSGKCTSSSTARACLYHCPVNCTCYHDITWKIVKIDCTLANLKSIPATIPNVTRTYYLDGNAIPSIDGTSLRDAQSLTKLYLNSSKIIRIENGAFSLAFHLEILHLDHNQLETLPDGVFKNLTKLKTLDLSFNQLNNLQEGTFSPLQSLQALNLQNNKLTDFPVWSLSALPSINQMALYDNPWSCSCSYALQYRAWLQSHIEKQQNVSKLTCTLDTPSGQKNISLTLFNTTHCYHTLSGAEQVDNGTSTAVIVVSVSIAISVLVLAALIFIYRSEIALSIERKFGRRLL